MHSKGGLCLLLFNTLAINSASDGQQTYFGREDNITKSLAATVDLPWNPHRLDSAVLFEHFPKVVLGGFPVNVGDVDLPSFVNRSVTVLFTRRIRNLDHQIEITSNPVAIQLGRVMRIPRGFELHVAKSSMSVVFERWEAYINDLAILRPVSFALDGAVGSRSYLAEEISDITFIGNRWKVRNKQGGSGAKMNLNSVIVKQLLIASLSHERFLSCFELNDGGLRVAIVAWQHLQAIDFSALSKSDEEIKTIRKPGKELT